MLPPDLWRERKKSPKSKRELSHPLYVYVAPGNGAYARTVGRERCGSFSAYVNLLISFDRAGRLTGEWAEWEKEKRARLEK